MASEMKADEADLNRRFRRGDEDAFRILCRRYAPAFEARARRWISVGLQRRVSIADVVQEARIVAFRKCAEFEDRGDGAFRRWLLGIIDHKAREQIEQHGEVAKRAAGREVTRGQREDSGRFRGNGPSPSTVAMAGERAEAARVALETLPAHYRQVLILTRQHGLTLADTALHIERSHEATKKLYGRALCKFKEAFARITGDTHV